MSGFEQWLRKPDARDIVPVRGVVMRIAADEIARLKAEIARLRRAAAAAAEPPAQIAFLDGATERTLQWTGTGYALPAGVETIDDVRAAAAAPAALPAADSAESAPEADAPAEGSEEADAADGEAAPEGAADDAAAASGADAEDDEDFELPAEWQ
ncbi:MAG: hypothetical protein NXI21_13665 [Alphaproteobacteria bacterium]|nr:hypothetical protein [Alphaproteobacteria bacterium]